MRRILVLMLASGALAVASGIRCKWAGAGSGFVIRLGDGTHSVPQCAGPMGCVIRPSWTVGWIGAP
jgi:hypothetical protein